MFLFLLPVGCLKWGIMRANLVHFCLLPKIDNQSQRGDDVVKVMMKMMKMLMVKVANSVNNC